MTTQDSSFLLGHQDDPISDIVILVDSLQQDYHPNFLTPPALSLSKPSELLYAGSFQDDEEEEVELEMEPISPQGEQEVPTLSPFMQQSPMGSPVMVRSPLNQQYPMGSPPMFQASPQSITAASPLTQLEPVMLPSAVQTSPLPQALDLLFSQQHSSLSNSNLISSAPISPMYETSTSNLFGGTDNNMPAVNQTLLSPTEVIASIAQNHTTLENVAALSPTLTNNFSSLLSLLGVSGVKTEPRSPIAQSPQTPPSGPDSFFAPLADMIAHSMMSAQANASMNATYGTASDETVTRASGSQLAWVPVNQTEAENVKVESSRGTQASLKPNSHCNKRKRNATVSKSQQIGEKKIKQEAGAKKVAMVAPNSSGVAKDGSRRMSSSRVNVKKELQADYSNQGEPDDDDDEDSNSTTFKKGVERTHLFFWDLLHNNQANPSLIRWIDKERLIFQVQEGKATQVIAQLWGQRKGRARDKCSWENLGRAIRYSRQRKNGFYAELPKDGTNEGLHLPRKRVFRFGEKTVESVRSIEFANKLLSGELQLK